METDGYHPGLSFIKNLAAQLFSLAGRMVMLTIVSILVARYLGAEVYGKYTAVIAYVTLFSFAVNWGLPRWIIREVAKEPEASARLISSGFQVYMISILLAVPLMVFVDTFANVSKGDRAFLLLAGMWVALGGIGQFLSGVFFALAKSEVDSIAAGIEALGGLIILVILLFRGVQDLRLLMLALAVSRLLSFTFLAWMCTRSVRGISLRWRFTTAVDTFRQSFPFGMQELLAYQPNLIIVLLNSFHGDVLTAHFRAAQTVCILVILGAQVVNNVFYPRLAEAYRLSMEAFSGLFGKSLHYMFMLSLPATMGLFVLSEKVLLLVYGPAFSGSGTYLRWLAITLPLAFISEALATALTASNRQVQRVKVMLVNAFFIITIGVWLIFTREAWGAVLVISFLRIISMSIYSLLVRIQIGWDYPIKKLLPSILATGLMTVLLFTITNAHTVVVVLLGGVLYLMLVLLLDSTLRSDIKGLRLFHFLRKWS